MSNELKLQEQWVKRPADQCFDSLEALHAFNQDKLARTRQLPANLAELKVKPIFGDKDIALEAFGKELMLTNYSFSKLAEYADMPPDTLRRLPAPMACDVLNYGLTTNSVGSKTIEQLEEWEKDDIGRAVKRDAKIIYESNGSDIVSTIVGPSYSLLPDSTVSGFAMDLADKYNLLPAPKTTGKVDGEVTEHRGLYASDRDTFIFLSDMDKPVLCFADSPIYRGLLLWNGYQRTFGGVGFDFAGICCNYSIHKYTERFKFNLKHSAKLMDNFDVAEIMDKAKEYFNGGTTEHQKFLEYATKLELGKNDDEVVETLVKLRDPLLGKRSSQNVIELAKQREGIYGNPRTVWSVGNVLTEIGRDRPTASARNAYMESAKVVFDLATV